MRLFLRLGLPAAARCRGRGGGARIGLPCAKCQFSDHDAADREEEAAKRCEHDGRRFTGKDRIVGHDGAGDNPCIRQACILCAPGDRLAITSQVVLQLLALGARLALKGP